MSPPGGGPRGGVGPPLAGFASRPSIAGALANDPDHLRLWIEHSQTVVPGNPQFNGESLTETLAPWQIGYEHIAALGGLRGRTRNVEPSPNGYWRVRSFRNYADYALTELFAGGLAHLKALGARHRCAIMCAEAVWWRCHRRIITDYLLGQGEHVMHILGPSHVDEASLTPGAVVRREGTIIYPAESPPLE